MPGSVTAIVCTFEFVVHDRCSGFVIDHLDPFVKLFFDPGDLPVVFRSETFGPFETGVSSLVEKTFLETSKQAPHVQGYS
jgi:hypothetical protein